MRIPALLLLMALFPAAINDKLQLLQPGTFHGDEVSARSGQHWLALVEGKHGFHLEPVVLHIDRVYDAILDETEKQHTGKEVKIQPELNGPLALVRGAGLAAGPVITAGSQIEIDGSAKKRIALGAVSYELALHCERTAPVGNQEQERCSLSIFDGHKKQKLATFHTFKERGQRLFSGERIPTVLWAGDMDNDGRLDLLIDTTDHYNVQSISLYLSSQEKPVRFQTTGC